MYHIFFIHSCVDGHLSCLVILGFYGPQDSAQLRVENDCFQVSRQDGNVGSCNVMCQSCCKEERPGWVLFTAGMLVWSKDSAQKAFPRAGPGRPLM